MASTRASEPSVRLVEVSKRFGEVRVLDGVSLEIARGELVVLLGRSGCGKSTLLRILAGLEDPGGGEVWLHGRLANHLAPRERDLAMVFQSYALYPHMTVRENLAFPLAVRKVGRAERDRRAAEVAETLGLGDLLDRRPGALSGGQRQRVAIGRALIRSPSLFLFDEPLSNLDAALRTRMRFELKALHARLGATMVYVTHDQVEAMTLATRVAILERGALQQLGTPEEIYRAPANLFVAAFVGSPAINVIEASAESGAFCAAGLEVAVPATWSAALPRHGRVTLAVRPERVRVRPRGGNAAGAAEGTSATDTASSTAPSASSASVQLAGKIELCEPVGDRGYLHLETPAGSLRAVVDGARAFAAREGDPVEVAFDLEDALLFDTETGARLATSP